MPLRSSPNALRRLCGLVLFAWLFAMLSGAAHACLLTCLPAEPAMEAHLHDVHDRHGGHGEAHHEAHHPPAAPQAQDLADHHADHHADEHAACHRFCQDSGTALSSSHHLHDTVDFTPVLVPWGGPVPPLAPGVLPLAHACLSMPPSQGPPLPIRFLRLTL